MTNLLIYICVCRCSVMPHCIQNCEKRSETKWSSLFDKKREMCRYKSKYKPTVENSNFVEGRKTFNYMCWMILREAVAGRFVRSFKLVSNAQGTQHTWLPCFFDVSNISVKTYSKVQPTPAVFYVLVSYLPIYK